MHGRFITAHIYLLGGCAVPLEIIYIIVKENQTNLEPLNLFYSFCGVIFLSIGDTLVFTC